MENFESLEIGDSIMSDWAQIISDALDILKFDGAVQDTLAELRRKWSGQIPALLEERFDTLGIQYMKLPHEMGVAALGQELSTFGWALYDLDEEVVSVCPDSSGRTQQMGTLLQKAGAILPPDETARAKMGRPCQGAGPWEADALRGIHTPR